MPAAVPHPHYDCTALLQGGDNPAILPDKYFSARYKFAPNWEFFDLAELVEPIAKKHHRHPRGSIFPELPFYIVGIQAVQHDMFDDVRRNLLPPK